jgi:hypothetical protein
MWGGLIFYSATFYSVPFALYSCSWGQMETLHIIFALIITSLSYQFLDTICTIQYALLTLECLLHIF